MSSTEQGDRYTYDATHEVSYERPAIDQFLLAIIDAYQGSETENNWRKARLRRLDGATLALFGEKSALGAKRIDDRSALWRMAVEHRRDIWLQQQIAKFGEAPVEGFKGVRSDLELARFVSNARAGTSIAADIERRSDAFGKQKLELLARLDFDDDANAQMGKNVLDQALRAVTKLGIKARPAVR